jgi:glutamyl-tRNA reductase
VHQVVVVGLSHRTASLETRERFTFEGEALQEALDWLRERGIEECAILSTCNRTEIYACTSHDDLLIQFLHEWEGLPQGELTPYLYVKRGEEAVEHLFCVAAGLDSQVLGESEILAQVKQAWEKAREADCTGVLLNSLFQRAVAVGKRVRAETALGRQAVSLGSLAVRAAIEHKPDIGNAVIIVIGTGTMGRRVVKELAEYRPKSLYILSHTFAYASALASDSGATPLALGALQQVLPEADIIFTATTAPHPILDTTCLSPLQDNRQNRPLLVLDLGVPRNTDPAVRLLPFVKLYDLEDLKALVGGTLPGSCPGSACRPAHYPRGDERLPQLVADTRCSPSYRRIAGARRTDTPAGCRMGTAQAGCAGRTPATYHRADDRAHREAAAASAHSSTPSDLG